MIRKNGGFPRKNGGMTPFNARQFIPFQNCASTNPAKNAVLFSS
jgi:hypothetical protein